MDTEMILRRFESPDEVRRFEKGIFELVHVGPLTLRRATYQPGWRWSEHGGKGVGQKKCMLEHVGIVVAGRANAAMSDGTVNELLAEDVFYIPPGHDVWVIGSEPCMSLHIAGTSDYAKHY